MIKLLLALAVAAAPEGRPLFYWGARPPVVVAELAAAPPAAAARVTEVHAAWDRADLALRLAFDRPVAEALRLADGTPVSGRLQAVLYFDVDDDRTTGLEQGAMDQRTGAERRLELGAVAMGEDPEEGRKAGALVAATLVSLTVEGRRRTLWRTDDEADPGRLSVHGDWVELRVPADRIGGSGRARLVLATGDRTWDGRIPPRDR